MPFESKAQQRKFFAMEARGEIPKGTARRWAHETPDIKALPEHKKPTKGKGETLLEHVHSTKAKHANYKLQGERKFRGLDIAIENRKGSKRKWFDPHGKEKGSTHMYFDYGYIRLTEGTDGDHVDVYVGPNESAEKVFVVDQMKKPDFKTFDEQKVMLGFDSAEAAKKAYLRQYNDRRFFGSMKEMSFEEFKTKVLDKSNHGKKIAKLLHTAGGAVFGGAAADSQVGIGIKEASGDMIAYFQDHPEKLKEKKERDRAKTAVSANWIREHSLQGLAKRGIGLDYGEQKQFARKAVDYVRARGGEAGPAATKSLTDLIDTMKAKPQNTSRRRVEPRSWRPATGPYTEAERENARRYDEARRGRREVNVGPRELTDLLGLGIGMTGGYAAGKLQEGPRSDLRKLTRAANRAEKGQEVNFKRVPEPASQVSTTLRGIALPVAVAASLGGTGMILGNTSFTPRGPAIGGGLGAVGGAALGRYIHGKMQRDLSEQRERLDPFMPKTAAISPALLSGLQHGAVGAGIGAVAGGLGGMAHADPNHRGQGFLRGAAVGAGLGAAGGAGISAIKQHGAQQLSSLRAQAGTAHQEALAAHQLAGKTHLDPALAGTAHAMPAAGGGTLAGKRGVVGGAGGAPVPAVNTQGKAVMQPQAWGHHPSQVIAPEIAQARASSAGGRAEALRQAAGTLEQQQGILNRGINRGALAGAAAGTGLMGYMAVPRQYGGVGIAPAKTADDHSRIADRIDDLGIATLASPYAADLAAEGLKRLMLRGGRLGAVAAEGHGIAEALAHKLHHPAVELGGLALVAPGVTHSIAKAVTPKRTADADQQEILKAAAEEVGRVLANVDHRAKHSSMGRLALGLGAVGAVGAGLYGGKKAIDTTKHLATAQHEPARYVGAPPGMRPPAPAGI